MAVGLDAAHLLSEAVVQRAGSRGGTGAVRLAASVHSRGTDHGRETVPARDDGIQVPSTALGLEKGAVPKALAFHLRTGHAHRERFGTP